MKNTHQINIVTGKMREVLKTASCLPSAILDTYEICFVGPASYEFRGAAMGIEHDEILIGNIEKDKLNIAYSTFGMRFIDACQEIEKHKPDLVKMPEPYNLSNSLSEKLYKNKAILTTQQSLIRLAENVCSYLYLVRKDCVKEYISDIAKYEKNFESFLGNRYVSEQRNIESVKFVLETIGLYS